MKYSSGTHLTYGDDALLTSHDTSTDHDIILVNNAVIRKFTHRVDGLLSRIALGRRIHHSAILSARSL